jgi:hypothetical protein
MDSALSTAMCVERVLLAESLWWFLHRTSCFSVEVRAEDLALLYGAVETLQPGLCPARCPDNAVSASFFPYNKTTLYCWLHCDQSARTQHLSLFTPSYVFFRRPAWRCC